MSMSKTGLKIMQVNLLYTGNIKSEYWVKIRKYKVLYLMLLPAFIYYLLFQILPYLGLTIAFQNFQPALGIWKSKWVGFDNFIRIFKSSNFLMLMKNTLLISVLKIIFGFPIPIIYALTLNELRNKFFKKVTQTITYFPHFLSWVVYGGVVIAFLSPSGVINSILMSLGCERIEFLTSSSYAWPIYVITNTLKEFGWTAIIYLAALTSIDPNLYAAADVDGAGRWMKMLKITLPSIMSTIIVMFIIQMGSILDAGFDQLLVIANPVVYDVSDIFDTYIYRIGLMAANFSDGAALGLFKGFVGFLLIVTSNKIVRNMGQQSIW